MLTNKDSSYTIYNIIYIFFFNLFSPLSSFTDEINGKIIDSGANRCSHRWGWVSKSNRGGWIWESRDYRASGQCWMVNKTSNIGCYSLLH